MSYIAVMNWTAEGRVTKFQLFSLEAEAKAHAAKGGIFPGTSANAFACAPPGGRLPDWLCDPVAKTLTLAPDLVAKAAKDKAENNASVLARIKAKELATERRVREVVVRLAMSSLPTDDTDRVVLEAAEAEFAALRGERQP